MSSHIWTDVPAALSMATVTSFPPTRSTIDTAAARLRQTVMAGEDGAFLGNEELLQAQLGASRATVRQVARMLESEGLLRVRRGINGGYFAARPNAETIEKSVSAYLEMLNVEGEDLITLASVLWIEVMRKAAAAPSPARVALATRHRAQLAALPDHVGYQLLQSVEQSFRTEIFSLIESRYIELIFHINMTFAQRRFPASDISEDSDIFLTFVHAWREARQMEINALMDGDAELGALSARHMRNIWQNFIRSRTS